MVLLSGRAVQWSVFRVSPSRLSPHHPHLCPHSPTMRSPWGESMFWPHHQPGAGFCYGASECVAVMPGDEHSPQRDQLDLLQKATCHHQPCSVPSPWGLQHPSVVLWGSLVYFPGF